MASIQKFSTDILRSICDIIGDTSMGLSGSEISRTLADCNIVDSSPGLTKRYRLFEALSQKQISDSCANNVLNYIKTVLNPVRYLNNSYLFNERRTKLNEVLLFAGLLINEQGQILETTAVKTIDEAQEKAGRLKKMLIDRNVHPDVLIFCKAELLKENYFHAVFEATKSVADKIRDKTGLIGDGTELIDTTFALGKTCTPKLAFNSLQSESEQSEHKGFSNLIKGMFGMFRNTTAHVPKIKWVINESDALDSLSLISLIHKKLDQCVKTGY